MKKLMIGLLIIISTNTHADDGILGAIGSAIVGSMVQPQVVQLGTLVQAANGQEYLVIQRPNGETLMQPVYVQRQGAMMRY